jgi:penicillin-binding protein A
VFFCILSSLLLCGAGVQAQKSPHIDLRHIHLSGKKATATIKGSKKQVTLTIDPALQKKAKTLLSESKAHEGAIVISDIKTGKILVWATMGGKHDWVSHPYAPSASVFKVVTAATLLESGKVNLATRQCYRGGERKIELEDLKDDISKDDRCTAFRNALGHSINLVFARLALKHLDAATLKATAAELGVGSAIPIDIGVERSTLHIPTKTLGFARASAGFWNGNLTPLSALFMMQTIANKGERIRLSVLDRSGGKRSFEGQAISKQSAQSLSRMLEVTTLTGTSSKVFRDDKGKYIFRHKYVAGKTGTLIGGKPTRMFSWFTGFAPSRAPKIAIAVLLANDVHWWTKANIVAKDMLVAYFEHQKKKSKSK